jgi:acetyl esterase/lipase
MWSNCSVSCWSRALFWKWTEERYRLRRGSRVCVGRRTQRFNAAGLHAFVVHYSVAPHRHPQPLRDAARAMRLIRQRAGEWQVDLGRIAICGFSAGGHLAASLGVHHASRWVAGDDPVDQLSCRPDGLILCYSVITAGQFAHQGSLENLLGPGHDAQLRREMSLEEQVDADTPPAFLWRTVADGSVPVENSVLFAQALRRHGTLFELHLYPHGGHGVGLSDEDPHVATWMGLCCEWLQGMGWGGV